MMLRSLEGREVFRDFLRSEYSEDNLLFWLACEELKKETNPSVVDEKARIIYEDYVSILSPKEVGRYVCLSEEHWRSPVQMNNPCRLLTAGESGLSGQRRNKPELDRA